MVPNATALIVSQDTGTSRQVQANESGEFLAPALEPGRYRITVMSPGFETFVAEGITLAIGQKASLKFPLTVGEAKQDRYRVRRVRGSSTPRPAISVK